MCHSAASIGIPALRKLDLPGGLSGQCPGSPPGSSRSHRRPPALGPGLQPLPRTARALIPLSCVGVEKVRAGAWGTRGTPRPPPAPDWVEAALEERAPQHGRSLRTPLPARIQRDLEGGDRINTFDFEAKVNGNCHPGRPGHWAPGAPPDTGQEGQAHACDWLEGLAIPRAAPQPDWLRRSDDQPGPTEEALGAAPLFSGANSRGRRADLASRGASRGPACCECFGRWAPDPGPGLRG